MIVRWASILLFLVVGATGAAAVEPDRAGDQAYRAGVELRRRGDDRGALREFRRAYGAAPRPRTLAQIGVAEQALGLWVDAEAHIGAALSAVGDSWIVTNRAPLQQALASVAAHLGSLEVECDTAGVTLDINGVAAGSLPLPKPVRVPAGTVVLSAHAPGFFPVQRVAMVAPGQLSHEQIEMVRMSPTAPISVAARPPVVPPIQTASSAGGAPDTATGAQPADATGAAQPRAAEDRNWQRTGGWVALGLAAASLGTGVVFHILHETRTTSYNRTDATGAHVCNRDAAGNFLGPRDCADAFNGATSARTMMIVGYSGAILFGAATAILFLTASSGDASAAEASASPPPAPRLACGVGPGVAGLACFGSF